MCLPVSTSVSASVEMTALEAVRDVNRIKRMNLQEKINTRFKGVGLIKEATYITADVGTAGFSLVKGVSLATKVSSALALVGSISGLVGGILNIVQGFFLFVEARQELKNGNKEQGLRLLADGLLLVGIGTLMFLASLVLFGILAGVAAVAGNPYVMPVLIALLVLPGLIQTLKHIRTVAMGCDVGTLLHLDDREQLLNNAYLKSLQELPEGADRFRKASELMETLSGKVGVEGAIAVFDLFELLLLKEAEQRSIDEKIQEVKERIATWNRMVRLRALQLSLYALTFPIGLASAFLAPSISRVMNAASRFFLAIPSSIGAYLDTCEPFKRNGAIAVPKAE